MYVNDQQKILVLFYDAILAITRSLLMTYKGEIFGLFHLSLFEITKALSKLYIAPFYCNRFVNVEYIM